MKSSIVSLTLLACFAACDASEVPDPDTTDPTDATDTSDTNDTPDTSPNVTDTSNGADATDTAAPPDTSTISAFEGLVARYDLLTTLAGRGRQRDEGNEWVSAYEGGPATASELSRPHMAMADATGHIFIADKEAHAIRRVDPDGTIHTVAGTGLPGDDGDSPREGKTARLTDPNGLHVTTSGVVFIVDLGNGKIRRLGPDGLLKTLVSVPGGISTGRGLWVSDDESLAYIASGDRVLRWRSGLGLDTLASGFVSLGNLALDPSPHPNGRLVVTDRGGHRVYRISDSGEKSPLAGNGTPDGGGEGAPALETGLNEPRAIAFTGDGGFLVGTHEGNQVWYVDPDGICHLFLDGGDNHAHSGDGENFRTPGEKVSEVRAITVAPSGKILITENDFGYIRAILPKGILP
jgi:hypothetical protein